MAASYLAAPRFTEEEEEQEQAEMTEEERDEALRDLYGDLYDGLNRGGENANDGGGGPGGAPSTTTTTTTTTDALDEPVERGLAELDAELARLAREPLVVKSLEGFGQTYLQTSCIERARSACPDIVDSDKHKLRFLRAENFNASLAAVRLINYWNERIQIFGDEKAFQRLTLTEALRDDTSEISLGFCSLAPELDGSGRAIVMVDQSKLEKQKWCNLKRSTMLRAVWYVFHAALENVAAQRRGVVLMIIPRNAQFDQFDRKLESQMTRSTRDVLPIRVVGVHVCHPPGFYGMIAPNAKYLLGRKMRARLRVHSGSFRTCLKELAEFGIGPGCVPSIIGGSWNVDRKWMDSRRSRGL